MLELCIDDDDVSVGPVLYFYYGRTLLFTYTTVVSEFLVKLWLELSLALSQNTILRAPKASHHVIVYGRVGLAKFLKMMYANY